MIVRMLTDRAGRGFYQRDGESYDLPDAEANELLRAGQAELVETMTRAAPENASRNHKKQARR